MLRRTVALLVLCLAAASNAHAQALAGTYGALLDRLFAVDDDGVTILRFVRSSEPELQVVFKTPFDDGDCSARVWHLPRHSAPLLDRLLSRLDARPPLETEAVFEGLVTAQTRVEVPCDGALARRMQMIEALSVPIPRDFAVAADGMLLQLEVRQGADRLTFETNVGGLEGPHNDPLVDWMASIGRAFRDAVRDEVLTALKRQEQQ